MESVPYHIKNGQIRCLAAGHSYDIYKIYIRFGEGGANEKRFRRIGKWPQNVGSIHIIPYGNSRHSKDMTKTPEIPDDPNFEDDDTGLFEFANISSKRTGLPFVVWISPRMGADHNIQVRVSYGPRVSPIDMISVALRPEVRIVGDGTLKDGDLDLLKQLIELNFDLILDYWEGRNNDLVEMLTSMKPLRS